MVEQLNSSRVNRRGVKVGTSVEDIMLTGCDGREVDGIWKLKRKDIRYGESKND